MKRFFALIPIIALVVALFVFPASADISPGHYNGWYFLEDGQGLFDALDGAFVLIPIVASSENFYDIVFTENYASLEFGVPFSDVTENVAFISGVVDKGQQSLMDTMLYPIYGSVGMTLSDFPLSDLPVKGCYIYIFDFVAPDVNNSASLIPFSASAVYDGIFGDLYYMLADAVYGGTDNITGYQELILTCVCTLAVVLMIALPFLLVWVIIRSVGVWR